MPRLQTYEVYTMLAAGGTKTYDSNQAIDVYEINANGGTITLLADMIFSYSGTPNIGCEFKFQYSGGVTQNSGAGRTVSFFGTDLTDAQALSQLVITAYWNGTTWEIDIDKDTSNNVVSVTTFGSTPNSAGLSINSGVLNMEPANATYGGGVSTTTQTFAGAKTFDILSGNFSIDSNGIGIGTAATSRVYINATKTFTTPITTVTMDVLNNNSVIFTYSNTVTEPLSGSTCGAFAASATGAYTPATLNGLISSTGNGMSATLSKAIGVRSQHLSSGLLDGTTTFNTNFLGHTFANKTSNTASSIIVDNYDYYSSTPYQLNAVAAGTPALFTITNQYGFYCSDYKEASSVPVPYGAGGGSKVSAVITNAWQLYLQGTNLTTIGSYIGNRLGVGFATAPTTNNQVTALLHIGAGTTSSAQIRLAVSSAPSAPNSGDIWLESDTNTGLKIRINGVTKTISLV